MRKLAKISRGWSYRARFDRRCVLQQRGGKGGTLAPQDKVANKDGTESTVLEVLTSKHPEAVHPKEGDLEEYSLAPEMVT